ncbi:MAG: S1 RNA-binding domain-containing protein, partial [Gammaproteobacteria bacterium]
MSEEILINVTPRETRAALVQNGILQEVYIERESYRGLVGNIYKGRVNRVLPGMEAAFVDIGLERAGFLHLSNLHESRQAEGQASISEILRVGQVLLVQIIKDPMGSKGARLTTCLSIPSRYLVYMPLESHIAFSQRIEDESEKQRIQGCLEQIMQVDQMKGGVIVRTAAEGLTYEELHTDLKFLQKIWEEITLSAENAAPESNVYEDLPLPVRVIRDLFHSGLDKIRVDSNAAYREVMRFSEKFIPEAMLKVEHYTGDRPIFDIYSVEDEIKRAL